MQHFNIHLLWRPFTTPEKIFFFFLITALLPLAAVRCSIRKKNDDDALFLQTVKRICLCECEYFNLQIFLGSKGQREFKSDVMQDTAAWLQLGARFM